MYYLDLTAIIVTYGGEILIAFTVLKVHYRMLHEHRMDNVVFREMKFEQKVGWIGVMLLSLGFLIRLVQHFL